MRLTTKGEYAVRAMIYLAKAGGNSPVQIREISLSEGISKAYIEQLFNKLRRSGIIKSLRGPSGGYVLGKPANKISIGDIIRSVEGPIFLTICSGKGGFCKRSSSCGSYPVWKKISRQIENVLDSIKLGGLK